MIGLKRKLKTNNLIQFANFVDIKLVREKYLLYIFYNSNNFMGLNRRI